MVRAAQSSKTLQELLERDVAPLVMLVALPRRRRGEQADDSNSLAYDDVWLVGYR